MDFGRVDILDLDRIDFSLPEDRPGTINLLKENRKKDTQIFIGCAKWGRKDWVGKIYPLGTKDSDFLEHYAQHFNSIELNATFYKMPDEITVKRWKSKVPNGFKFCPKFTDVITHIKRLKDATELTNQFLRGVSFFEENLGPAFLQLPPNFGPKHQDLLLGYLKALPNDFKVFVELRHPDWFKEQHFDPVFDALHALGRGSVITDAAGRRDCVHGRLTTPDAFVRFVGNSLHATDYTRIDEWIQKLGTWVNHGLDDLYFFMHQHDELYSPELILYQIQKMNQELHLNIPLPKYSFLPKQTDML